MLSYHPTYTLIRTTSLGICKLNAFVSCCVQILRNLVPSCLRVLPNDFRAFVCSCVRARLFFRAFVGHKKFQSISKNLAKFWLILPILNFRHKWKELLLQWKSQGFIRSITWNYEQKTLIFLLFCQFYGHTYVRTENSESIHCKQENKLTMC